MNRIKRIAAATAVSTAGLIPFAAAVASAEPTQAEPLLRQEQQYMQQPVDEQLLRQEQQYMQEQVHRPHLGGRLNAASASALTSSSPWETVGLSALGAAVLAAGGVVLVRQYHHEPHPV